MKKVLTKPIIAAALVVSVAGISSVPLVANAQAGNGYYWNGMRMQRGNYNNYRNYNNNYTTHHRYSGNNWWRWWNSRNRQNRPTSNQNARYTAQRYYPGRYIVSEEVRWENGRHEHRYRFNDNHCVDVRDDGVVMRAY